MSQSGAAQSLVSERVKSFTVELQELERLVLAGDCAPRVLNEFRTAIDNIRQSAWAVQQWTSLQQQQRDPYSVLDILAKERVRRATQLARDLRVDLESLELTLDTEGLAELFHSVTALHERLAPLFKRSEASY
jgi:hypothetical protein